MNREKKKIENEEVIRLDNDRLRRAREAGPGYDEAERGGGGGSRRRLTYDHGQAFGGDSSPLRSDNYETLVGYLTEIGEEGVSSTVGLGFVVAGAMATSVSKLFFFLWYKVYFFRSCARREEGRS